MENSSRMEILYPIGLIYYPVTICYTVRPYLFGGFVIDLEAVYDMP